MELNITPEAQELATQSEQMLTTYQDFKVVSNPEYTSAGEHLKKIKGTIKRLEDERKLITDPMNKAKSAVMLWFRKPLDFLVKAEGIIKQSMLTFSRQQEEIRRKEEAKLQERARKEEEAAWKRLEERAKKAEEQGKAEKAELLRQKKEEVHVAAPVLQSEVPEVKGQHTKTVWKYRVINALVVPREYLIVNDKMLSQFAVATKGKLPVAGVEFYSEEILSSRGE